MMNNIRKNAAHRSPSRMNSTIPMSGSTPVDCFHSTMDGPATDLIQEAKKDLKKLKKKAKVTSKMTNSQISNSSSMTSSQIEGQM